MVTTGPAAFLLRDGLPDPRAVLGNEWLQALISQITMQVTAQLIAAFQCGDMCPSPAPGPSGVQAGATIDEIPAGAPPSFITVPGAGDPTGPSGTHGIVLEQALLGECPHPSDQAMGGAYGEHALT